MMSCKTAQVILTGAHTRGMLAGVKGLFAGAGVKGLARDEPEGVLQASGNAVCVSP